ncbi:MAG: hypothetical protein R2850_01060 [Bacteroidia bacterium]
MVTLSLDRTFTAGDGDEMTMDVRADLPDPEEHMIRKQKMY